MRPDVTLPRIHQSSKAIRSGQEQPLLVKLVTASPVQIERKTQSMFQPAWLIRALLAVQLIVLVPANRGKSDDYDVYLLAGQSNMDGRGKQANLEPSERVPFENAVIFYRNPPYASSGWQSLQPGFSVPPKFKGELPSTTFGPEIGFARTILQARPERKLALIKGSKGGTSLRIDWNPGTKNAATSQGPRYRDFLETIRLATQELEQAGHQLQIRGLLWHQGESDAKLSVEVYEELLRTFIRRIREDLGQAELLVVVGEVFDNGNRDTVRQATRNVGTSAPNLRFVSSEGTATWDEGTHFDAASQILLGKRYADATLDAENNNTVRQNATRKFVHNSRLLLGTQTNRSASVRSGDLDGDGDQDLVVANGRHWPEQNFVFLNQGRGRFNLVRPLGLDLATSYACEMADLDGDGDLDIAVGNDQAPCRIFLNNGRGIFSAHSQFGELSSVRSLALADLDGDEAIDIVVTCRGRPNQIHFNDGAANFHEQITFGDQRDSTIDVGLADVNEDGQLDLLLANRDSQPNCILLSDGQRGFGQPIKFGPTNGSSRAIATGDFNGDGHVDWAVGNIAAENAVYYGDGKAGVLNVTQFGRATDDTYCLAIADLNNDKRLDIIAGNAGQQNGAYMADANGQGFVETRFGVPTALTYGLCVADLDNDSFPDIAVANSDGQNRIFLNRPSE